jgi:putative ABC transport system permease protein
VKWGHNLKLSAQALSRARSRTLLCSSSMTIGISALFILLSLSAGSEKVIETALESIGKNLLAVGSRRKESDALRGKGQRFQTLTLDDWQAISSQINGVERAAPIAMNSFNLLHHGNSMTATVIGTTPEFEYSNVQHPSAGRFIDDFDLQSQARVAVIGTQVVQELFFGEEAIGKRLLIAGAPYEVIGILQQKGPDPSGSPQDDKVFVPVTTAMRRLLNVDFVDRIFIQASSAAVVDQVKQDTRELLRQRHGTSGRNQADDFTITDQANLVRTISQSKKTMTRFLAGLSILLLGLASVGLLAVSLLSVRERHAEIGLRLAIGALPHHLVVQFLAEAAMIAVLGIVSGLLVGGISIILGQKLMGWQLEITGMNALYTMLIPMGLALLSGAYPAFKAARLDPIQALRG